MEYGVYLVIVLVIVALCVFQIRRLNPVDRSERFRGRKAVDADVLGSDETRQLLQRDVRHVPTPWGWPGSAGAGGGQYNGTVRSNGTEHAPGTLHSWVDHLVHEKQTKDGAEYQQRRDASMRALLEDRFYSASHANGVGVGAAEALPGRDSRKIHAKSGQADKASAKAGSTPGNAPAARAKATGNTANSLSDVRTPWGW